MGFIHRSKSKFKNSIDGESGITLVELLIAIVFMSVVLMVATAMIIQSYDIFYGGTERMTASQMAEMAVTEISNIVRGAEDENYIDEDTLSDDGDSLNLDDIELVFEKGEGVMGNVLKLNGRVIAFNVKEFEIDKNDPRYKIRLSYVDRDENEKDRSTTVRRRN